MVVKSDEFRLGIGLCHQDSRGSESATHVSHRSAGLEFGLRVGEGRNPLRDQVSAIVGTEEALRTGEQAGVMFMPANTFSAAEGVGDLGNVPYGRFDDLEKAGKKDGAVF